jgi:hypothetical protein
MRRCTPLDDREPVRGGVDIEALVGKPRERKGGMTKRQREKYRAEIEDRIARGVWRNISPTGLVALYERFHEHVYGVPAAEVDTPRAFLQAARVAGTMLKREFGGDGARAVEFMFWVWKRETERETWRRENHRDGGRIGWRLQFSGALLTDFRIARARHNQLP